MTTPLDLVGDHIKNLNPYKPGKTIDEIRRVYGLKDIIKLASNENPLGPSPKVKEVLAKKTHLITQYPEDYAPLLREQLSDLIQVEKNQLTFGAGSSEIFDMVVKTFLPEGAELIISDHAFSLYKVLGYAANANVVIIPNQNWKQDWKAMLAAITDKTRLLILDNPNNPTGSWLNSEELYHFIKGVPKHVVVVIDEAYVEYMEMPEYASAIPWVKEFSNLIVARTLSKIYGLAGMRIGYGVSSPEIAGIFDRIRKPFNVSSTALVAAQAALSDSEYVAESIEVNQKGRQRLHAFFKEINLPVIAFSGNFLTVVFGKCSSEIVQQLLETGVIIRGLLNYNMPNHLRISVGTSTELNIFINKLEQCFTVQRNSL